MVRIPYSTTIIRFRFGFRLRFWFGTGESNQCQDNQKEDLKIIGCCLWNNSCNFCKIIETYWFHDDGWSKAALKNELKLLIWDLRFVIAFYTLLLWYTHSTFLRFCFRYKITRKMDVKLSTDFSSLWGCTGWRWVIECKLQIFNLVQKPTIKTTTAFLIDLLTAFYSVSCKTCKMTSIAYLSSYHHSLRIWLPQKWSPMYLTKNI